MALPKMVFQHKWHKLLQATWLRKRGTFLAGGHYFLMPTQTPAVAIMDKGGKKTITNYHLCIPPN